MSKITDLYDYFLECPYLKKLLPISAEEERGKDVFFPRGSSPIYAVTDERYDVLGNYNSTLTPYLSVYDDWQMNLYRYADPSDERQDKTNINIKKYDEVENVNKWILEKNGNKDLPNYNGLKIFGVVPAGTMPVIWGADTERQEITYAITIRVYYVNPNKPVEVEFNGIED